MGVFDGIKILQFAWVAAGPLCIQPLADQGATVIKVESSKRPDLARLMAPYKDGIPGIERGGFFAVIEHNRYSLALDLEHPRSKEIVTRLIRWADIVAENFRPGAMGEMGLDYSSLAEVNPAIICVHASIQGQTGPHSKQPGFGIFATGLAGITALAGWPDRPPVLPFDGYADYILPRFAAVALIAALDYRRRTGKGQDIDLSQVEAVMPFIAPLILDYSVNRRQPARIGNACPSASPHGVFPCRGEDRWIAISVSSDREWIAFCGSVGHPECIRDSRFSTLLSRKKHESELSLLVDEWTAGWNAEELMTRLQENGVAAGIVESAKDLVEDPQLKERPAFWHKEHPVLGHTLHSAELYRLSDTAGEARLTSPLLGEHTELICRQFLRMSVEEYDSLNSEGVFC